MIYRSKIIRMKCSLNWSYINLLWRLELRLSKFQLSVFLKIVWVFWLERVPPLVIALNKLNSLKTVLLLPLYALRLCTHVPWSFFFLSFSKIFILAYYRDLKRIFRSPRSVIVGHCRSFLVLVTTAMRGDFGQVSAIPILTRRCALWERIFGRRCTRRMISFLCVLGICE